MNFKKAFTILEMMIVVLIIGVGLIGVISTITISYKFLYTTKNKITAINIARGGTEAVFNIRNTNWQRWSGKKDQCWLKIDPLSDDDKKCENDAWFGSGPYVLLLSGNNQKYFALSGMSMPLNFAGNVTGNDWNYLVCENTDGIVTKCNSTPNKRPSNYFSKTALFFQQIRGGYLNDKNNNNNITCSKGNDTNCGDGRALEKNFCVDVVYFDGTKKNITFCSVLTNFKK